MRNLNEDNITQAVLARLVDMPENRLKTILVSLVQHLHTFARETKLTEAEWKQGIDFLTATGHLCDGTRQEFILLSDTLGLSQLVVAQNHRRSGGATEQTVFGPFHVPGAPVLPPHGADITNGAVGESCFVSARVLTASGTPLAGATVDCWQADSEGFYDVQDSEWAQDNMSLRARFVTDESGALSMRTVLPKSYPIPTDGTVGQMLEATHRSPMRPAHIHFMVQKPGYDTLVTHIFAEGDEYLDSDAVFGVRSSCVGEYVKHAPGIAPDGTRMNEDFYTMQCDLVLEPLVAT
ncbi:intradiol ring-cleavage dioxygenase [Cupriavidus sp. 8B]